MKGTTCKATPTAYKGLQTANQEGNADILQDKGKKYKVSNMHASRSIY